MSAPSHLIVTAGRDGGRYASIRLEQRINAADLARGICWLLESQFEELCELTPLARSIAALGRHEVYDATREMFAAEGANHADAVGERCHRQTWGIAALKVKELFPEFG